MTLTDDHTTILDRLDFTPPCEVILTQGDTACPGSAEWVTVFQSHCSKRSTKVTFLLCEEHHNDMQTGGIWLCGCGKGVRVLDLLIRTERIKP